MLLKSQTTCALRKLNLLDLPVDLQYRILRQLDWCTLPKAAATCRLWSELVRAHSRSKECTSQWSHAMFLGEPSESAALRQDSSCARFVQSLLHSSKYLNKSTRPDAVFITATPSWQPHLQQITDSFAREMPNWKSVHVLCCVAVGIVGTDEKGQVHEIEDGNMEAEAIAVALLHVRPDQQVFSVSESNTSARERYAHKISTRVDDTLDEIEAVVRSTERSCACKEDRSLFGFLVGDNVSDISDLKTKIEAKVKSIHMMGGLCGYDSRKQAVYHSCPASRLPEQRNLNYPTPSSLDVEEDSSSRLSFGSSQAGRTKLRTSAAALFVCNMKTSRASYRGIYQLMSDYKVASVDNDEEGTKVFSLRKCIKGSNNCSAPEPIYEVLRELENSHGSLHGVTFGVKRRVCVSVDSEDSCILCDNNGVSRSQDLKSRIESVDIVRGVWSRGSDTHADRLEAIVVPLNLRPGDICSFYSYSAKESLMELGEIIETLEKTKVDASASILFGGFLVICNARGSYLHNGLPNVESKMLGSTLPQTPLIGFFANGEIGPMPFREWSLTRHYYQSQESNPDDDLFDRPPEASNTVLQGNTSVLAIMRS